MCQRVVCPDCGKWTWAGCGLHIAQALAGLELHEICSCDDDKDSEHSWATLTLSSPSRPVPRYPLPFASHNTSSFPSSPSSSSAATAATASSPLYSITASRPAATSITPLRPNPACPTPSDDHSTPCVDPTPIEYKLSRISTTSASEAAFRMAQQAAALEELRRIKQEKDKALKEANQDALSKLLQGLSEAKDG